MDKISKSKSDENDEPCCVASGPHGDVLLYGEALSEYLNLQTRNDQTSLREAVTLKRYFERYAATGPKGFSDKMYKSLGRQKTGDGKDALVHEFKAYQFRIYGVVCTFKEKRNCFIGTACDESKKKNKADPKKLKKAAEVWVRIEK